jgi:hypothetical protein
MISINRLVVSHRLFTMTAKALGLCEVPKKNRAKRGFFRNFVNPQLCTKGNRRGDFLKLWCRPQRVVHKTSAASLMYNVLGLCKEAELKTQMFSLAQMFIRISNVQFITELAFFAKPLLVAAFNIQLANVV